MTTLATLKKRTHDLLRDYARAELEARTPITRALADVLVEARSHFTDADGETDWKGKTYPYRQWVRSTFDDAGLRGDESKRVQSAIRYHVGTALRKRLSEEDLERFGLQSATPRERSHDRRQQRSAILNVLNAREVAGGALLALTATNSIIARIDLDEIESLDEHGAAVALATIQEIERHLRAAKKRLKG